MVIMRAYFLLSGSELTSCCQEMDLGRSIGVVRGQEDIEDEAAIGIRRICRPNDECPATCTHTLSQDC